MSTLSHATTPRSWPPCAANSNEITAIPRLLECLVLDGAVVTIDAAGCQWAIVQELRVAGTDHVLAVKRNQRTLHAKVRAAFEEADKGAFTPEMQDRCETVEHHGGRRERRTCTPGWPRLLRTGGRFGRVARPVPPDPGADGTPRLPQATAFCPLLHIEPARGRRSPAGTEPRPLAGAL